MKPKIVIIGGGFAGNNIIRYLDNDKYEVILVDKNNYTFFPPLLYQVSTGFLEPSSISYPFRKMLRHKRNLTFKMGELISVDPENNSVTLSTGKLNYDFLIISTGTETNYFGMENVEKFSMPMKSLNDAIELRNYILAKIEEATTFVGEPEKLYPKLRVVIAGGGPTGVEISGMLAEMQSSVFIKDYPELNGLKQQDYIYLIDGASAVLAPMSTKSQQDTKQALEELGVKVILNTQVKDFDGKKVLLSDGTTIETENLIWAAGVTAKKFPGLPQEAFGRGGRMKVDAFNRLQNYHNIFAIRDTCILNGDKNFPDGHPQVAQVALQQGENLAKNFNKMSGKRQLIPFVYKDKGSMAIIGRNKAVADLPKQIHFKGFIAWLLWIFVHLMSLVNYRNRVTTFFNWLTAYFTRDQALRMIIRPKKP